MATRPGKAEEEPLDAEAQAKFDLITENLQEVLNPEIVKKILAKGRPVKIYWGTATTGMPHCGYFVPALKIAQFLAAGCEVTILLADIHGFLDNLKAPIEKVGYRAQYYEIIIQEMLKAVGVPLERLRFVRGSSYQKSPEYIMDVYKICSLVSEHQAKRAGAEVVKQSNDAPLSGLLYPILQVLDEQYLDCDAQFGGVDQRKLFAAAVDWLPKVGYRKRAHLMNPMVPGLKGSKMSSSDASSKIDLLEIKSAVDKKIDGALCSPGQPDDNGLLAFTEFVLLPASALKDGKKEFRVERRDGLEPLIYSDISKMREDYKNDVLRPQDLKAAVKEALNALLAPIQKWQKSLKMDEKAMEEAGMNEEEKMEKKKEIKEWQNMFENAYPVEYAKWKADQAQQDGSKKKVKKVKDKGTRHPGNRREPEEPKVGEQVPVRPKE